MATESTFKGVWVGTQSQYDALASHDPDILYATTDKTVPVPTASDAGKVVQVNSSGNYALQPLQTKVTATIPASSWVNGVATVSVTGLRAESDTTQGYRANFTNGDSYTIMPKFIASAGSLQITAQGTVPTTQTTLVVLLEEI